MRREMILTGPACLLLICVCFCKSSFEQPLFKFNPGERPTAGTSIVISTNADWSSITTGSGVNGQPTCADEIIVSGNSTLTIDVSNAQCQNLFVNKTDDASTAILKFNSGSQLSVCNDLVIGSSLGTGRTGVLDMTTGGLVKINGSFFLTPLQSTFIPGNGEMGFGGAVAQSIPSSSYHHLTTSGNGVKTLSGPIVLSGSLTIGTGTIVDVSSGNNFSITLAGDWTNNGSFTQRSGTVAFNGNTQLIKGTTTTAFSTVSILTGSTVTGQSASTASIANILSGAKYIQTAGTSILGSSSKNFATGSTYELRLSTASGFSFSGNTYGNLIINFSGSSGLNTNGVLTTVNNDLVIKNTGSNSFRFASSQSPTINIAGSFKVESGSVEVSTTTGAPVVNVAGNFEQTGGSLKLSTSTTGGQQMNITGNILLAGGSFQPMGSSGIPSINVKGNWISNGGNFISGVAVVQFNGAAPQNITGNAAATFNNLTVNNPNGIFLNGVDANVNTALSFMNGKVFTGTNKLVMGTAANFTGANNGSYVSGLVKRWVSSLNNVSLFFPVGDATNYAPVSIDFSGTALTGGSLEIFTGNSVPPVESGINQSRYLNRKWNLTANGLTGFNSYNATFNFSEADKSGNPDPSLFVIRKWNNNQWLPTTTGSLLSNSSQCTGLNSFGEFFIGEPNCNFPNVADFNLTTLSSCTGKTASVQIISNTITDGNYTVNYSLSGTNSSANNFASITMNGGNGNFNTPALNNTGSTTITIQSISSGNCKSEVFTGNSSTYTVNSSTVFDTTATVCDSAEWFGEKFYESAELSHVFTNANQFGCDSIVNLHLTVHHHASSSFNVESCDHLLLPWGETVSSTGVYVHFYQTVYGCDSVVTAHVIIHPDHSTAFDTSCCDQLQLPWGDIVTTSGDYFHHYQSMHGCDSLVIAHVLIHSQPGSGILEKFPDVEKVCDGQNVSALLTPGNGGCGQISDRLEFKFDNDPGWSEYLPGQLLMSNGKSHIQVRTYRIASGAGCNSSTAVVASWSVNREPVVTNDRNQQSAVYGVPISAVNISATDEDSPGSSLIVSNTSYRKDGGAINPGLPAGLTLSSLTSDLHSRNWQLTGVASANTGDYEITVTVSDECGAISTTLLHLLINPASASPLADAYYTGACFFWTNGSTSNTATLTLAATVKNTISNLGDIRTAKISFFIRTGIYPNYNLTPITGAQNLAVGLVNPNDLNTGSASATIQYNLGSNTATSLDIAVKVSGNYQNNVNDASTDKVITVAVPVPGGQICGGGNLDNAGSAGIIAGAANELTNFSFFIQYNRSQKNPQGNVEVKLLSLNNPSGVQDGRFHVYKIKSNAISSLAVNAPTAQFAGKCNVSEIINGVETGIQGNCILQLDLFDSTYNVHNTKDSLAITVYRNDGGIWFSSKWNGIRTVRKKLFNGHVAVSGNSGASLISKLATPERFVEYEADPFAVSVVPNPTNQAFLMKIESGGMEKAVVMIYDSQGRKILKWEGFNKSFCFGENFTKGIYFFELTRGEKRKTIKLLKQ